MEITNNNVFIKILGKFFVCHLIAEHQGFSQQSYSTYFLFLQLNVFWRKEDMCIRGKNKELGAANIAGFITNQF